VPGYGSASITGLLNCHHDLVIIVEPDGTFLASDIEKLLSFSQDFDVVFGSRTSSHMIWEGAYMPHWVRFGNWVCAKAIEILFNGPCLSDVGCTYKLLTKSTIQAISDKLYVTGSHFSPHLMIECLLIKAKCIEIPVNYLPRTGESKITGGNVARTIRLGLRMFLFIFSRRVFPSRFPNKRLKKRENGLEASP
jgi:hypothetical protein